MKTAEEKREVAENLRAQAAYPGNSSTYMEAFIEDLKQIIDINNMGNNYGDLYDVLADLIEPSEVEQWVTSQGLTKEQLEFDWWLSGRVMHELGFDGDTADRDEVESRLLARLMPEGMEWPRFEDGEPWHAAEQLTHTRPALDADGVPICGGECVLGINGGLYRVTDASCGEVFARHVGGPFGAEVESAGGEGLYRLRANRLTHTKPEPPDSWERVEDDAKKDRCSYFGVKFHDCERCTQLDTACAISKDRDLVRRCRALAERGE